MSDDLGSWTRREFLRIVGSTTVAAFIGNMPMVASRVLAAEEPAEIGQLVESFASEYSSPRVLIDDLNDAREITVSPEGDIYFVQRTERGMLRVNKGVYELKGRKAEKRFSGSEAENAEAAYAYGVPFVVGRTRKIAINADNKLFVYSSPPDPLDTHYVSNVCVYDLKTNKVIVNLEPPSPSKYHLFFDIEKVVANPSDNRFYIATGDRDWDNILISFDVKTGSFERHPDKDIKNGSNEFCFDSAGNLYYNGGHFDDFYTPKGMFRIKNIDEIFGKHFNFTRGDNIAYDEISKKIVFSSDANRYRAEDDPERKSYPITSSQSYLLALDLISESVSPILALKPVKWPLNPYKRIGTEIKQVAIDKSGNLYLLAITYNGLEESGSILMMERR